MLEWSLLRGVAENCGIELAIEQHLLQLFSGRRALDSAGIAILGHMRLLERDPRDALEINVIVTSQNPSHPHPRRDGVGAHADPFAVEICRCEQTAIRVVEDRVMLTAAHDRG